MKANALGEAWLGLRASTLQLLPRRAVARLLGKTDRESKEQPLAGSRRLLLGAGIISRSVYSRGNPRIRQTRLWRL